MPLSTKVHKSGLKTGFNSGDLTLVNIGLLLFSGSVLDV